MRTITALKLAAALAGGTLFGSALPAQEKKPPAAIDPRGLKPEKKAAPLSPKELTAKVIADIQKVQQEGGKREKLIETVDAGLDRFIEAILANPKAPEAAGYAAAAPQFITSKERADKLIVAVRDKTDLLKGDKPALGFIIAMNGFDPKFIDAVMQANPSKDIAGLAKYLKAKEAMDQYEESEKEADKKAALELIAAVPAGIKVEMNGELQDLGRKALEFKDQIARIEALAVGRPMPELRSKDLDGKAVKLSDYKGKVVVVDVWATWCGPCRQMIPHERELVKQMKDKPFAFISISGDDEVGTLKKFLETEEMPWTHWHAGQDGEVMKALNISHFPTIYIVDAKGVIRFKEIRGKEMDKAVETLVKEAGEK